MLSEVRSIPGSDGEKIIDTEWMEASTAIALYVSTASCLAMLLMCTAGIARGRYNKIQPAGQDTTSQTIQLQTGTLVQQRQTNKEITQVSI